MKLSSLSLIFLLFVSTTVPLFSSPWDCCVFKEEEPSLAPLLAFHHPIMDVLQSESTQFLQAQFFAAKAYKGAQGKYLGYPRDFNAKPTSADTQDIRYLVLTLANRSVLYIAKEKELLERIGDRIDYLHPLIFLEAIFSEDELKVAVKNIRSKGWVWSNFMNGLVETLQVEQSIDNVTHEMLSLFATNVKVSLEGIEKFANQGAWEEMVNFLIAEVHRNASDSNRYDF